MAQAEVVALSKTMDLAIVKLEQGEYVYASVDASDSLPMLGADIVILGFPFGGRMNDDIMGLELSFTKGYISSNQTIKGQRRTLLDISAKAGNSGSPVVSCESGDVVGILAGSYTGGAGGQEEINYMIPISYLFELVRD